MVTKKGSLMDLLTRNLGIAATPRVAGRVMTVLLAVGWLAAVPASARSVTSFADQYDRLLGDIVDADGWVDYDALAEHPGRLHDYVRWLAEPTAVPEAVEPERLAVLINAYNAFTLKLILDHYDQYEAGEVESITDLHGGQPWDEKTWNLGGQTVSLNQLEHEIIRKQFPQEPRIHWAVNCAAYSCPPLRNEAYAAERLDEQLAEQEAYVLNFDHPRYLQRRGGELSVTKLFEWYGGDFDNGRWKGYVLDRIDATENEFGPFLPYDWRLNSQANRPQ
jgi:hypothetical protein